MTSRSIRTDDGTDLYVEISGQGAPCLYIHGGPGSGGHWMRKFAGDILERCFRMVYLDQRGVARSTSAPDGNYTPERMVEDFEQVRMALDIEQWLTLGHSFGGLLQMAYAQRHPNAIRGMIMLNCSLDLKASSADALPQARAFLCEQDPAYRVDESLPVTEQLMSVYQQLREHNLFWKMGYAALESSERMDASFAEVPDWNHDLEDKLPIDAYMVDFKPLTPTLSMPVLFFYGKTDWMIGPEHYRGVSFPNMLLWPSEVGHMPFLENLADLEAAIDCYCAQFQM